MIEKLNRVFEKLPPEHRDIIREAFTILIEEVINAIVKEIRDGFERQGKENERIWQAIKEGFERQEKENQRIWQAIEEMRKSNEEQFKEYGRLLRKIENPTRSNLKEYGKQLKRQMKDLINSF
jgi:TRAP-type C4-dicarboxylate transport system substrate-binding protein